MSLQWVLLANHCDRSVERSENGHIISEKKWSLRDFNTCLSIHETIATKFDLSLIILIQFRPRRLPFQKAYRSSDNRNELSCMPFEPRKRYTFQNRGGSLIYSFLNA